MKTPYKLALVVGYSTIIVTSLLLQRFRNKAPIVCLFLMELLYVFTYITLIKIDRCQDEALNLDFNVYWKLSTSSVIGEKHKYATKNMGAVKVGRLNNRPIARSKILAIISYPILLVASLTLPERLELCGILILFAFEILWILFLFAVSAFEKFLYETTINALNLDYHIKCLKR